MDLVDEQDVALLEAGQDRGHVLPLQRRAGDDPDPDAELLAEPLQGEEVDGATEAALLVIGVRADRLELADTADDLAALRASSDEAAAGQILLSQRAYSAIEGEIDAKPVSEQQLKDSIVCDADLWASCIGGAAQQDAYRETIEGAGLRIEEVRDNPYEFISEQARDASAKYGVKSVSLLALKGGAS